MNNNQELHRITKKVASMINHITVTTFTGNYE
jgi:hypothetical protein